MREGGAEDRATQLYAAAIDRGLYARVAERIDLHDHPATVAVAAVAFAMGEFARKRAPIPSAGFTIVTGRGAGSVDNAAVIRPRVVCCSRTRISARCTSNPGQLVEAADLAAWASAQSSFIDRPMRHRRGPLLGGGSRARRRLATPEARAHGPRRSR